jgi:hypothetical protein
MAQARVLQQRRDLLSVVVLGTSVLIKRRLGPLVPVVRHQRWLSNFIVDDVEDNSHLKQRTGEGLGKGVALARLHNPKQFGSIPDVPVGKAWPLQAGASMDAIHAPLVACISGNPTVGAWSVCFSMTTKTTRTRSFFCPYQRWTEGS